MECRACSHCRCCKTVRDLYPRDLSTLSHFRFLYFTPFRRLPPLEMTREDRHHFSENDIENISLPVPVISTGVIMIDDSAIKNRYSFEESRNLSCFLECRACSHCRCCKTVRDLYPRDLSTLSHFRFLYFTPFRRLPPLEMTREDRHHFSENDIENISLPVPVISTGVIMIDDSAVNNRYSFDEWRNLSCFRECRACSHCRCCKTVRDLYPRDLSTLSHFRFLYFTPFRRLPPLEMTREDRHHFSENDIENISLPVPVISTGVIMIDDSAVNNRYSFDEWRNLSCFRECRVFLYPAFRSQMVRQSEVRQDQPAAFPSANLHRLTAPPHNY
ncbi:MAG: hypothetical protein ACFWUL_00300 [Dialister sp.]